MKVLEVLQQKIQFILTALALLVLFVCGAAFTYAYQVNGNAFNQYMAIASLFAFCVITVFTVILPILKHKH